MVFGQMLDLLEVPSNFRGSESEDYDADASREGEDESECECEGRQENSLLELPEDVCGIYAAIANAFGHRMTMISSCFTWDAAYQIGKALAAHRLVSLETGGYLEPALAGDKRREVAVSFDNFCQQSGYIDYDLAWGRPDSSGSRWSDALAHVLDPSGNIDLCAADASWNWMKAEIDDDNSSFSSSMSM